MEAHTLTDEQKHLVTGFTDAVKKLKLLKEDSVSRNARLLDIRYRLTLDLRISIETEYSSTKTKSVHDVYELLFKFLDLWNVYEVCCAYGKELGVFTKNKVSGWKDSFLKETGILPFLERQTDAFRRNMVSASSSEKYRQYLAHFSVLDAVKDHNKKKYQKYLEASAEEFDYMQLLFIQYMERNSYYHGGEAAKAGSDYKYRQKQLLFFIDFLTEFIAVLGSALFEKESNDFKGVS